MQAVPDLLHKKILFLHGWLLECCERAQVTGSSVYGLHRYSMKRCTFAGSVQCAWRNGLASTAARRPASARPTEQALPGQWSALPGAGLADLAARCPQGTTTTRCWATAGCSTRRSAPASCRAPTAYPGAATPLWATPRRTASAASAAAGTTRAVRAPRPPQQEGLQGPGRGCAER